LGIGVNPSPVPEPHNFQKPTPSRRRICERANPIMAKAQSLLSPGGKRKKLIETVWMAKLLGGVPLNSGMLSSYRKALQRVIVN
jgi:hypothetical protein